jgi:hypothetical protein
MIGVGSGSQVLKERPHPQEARTHITLVQSPTVPKKRDTEEISVRRGPQCFPHSQLESLERCVVGIDVHQGYRLDVSRVPPDVLIDGLTGGFVECVNGTEENLVEWAVAATE